MIISDLRTPGWWGGIVLALAVAFSAGIAAEFVGESLLGFERSPVSDIMMAIIIGMLVANLLPLPATLAGGLKFCASTVLRIGIMLLGVRLSLFGAGKFTLVALPFVVVAIAIGLTTVGLLGRSIGLSRQLSGLIAVGTSICGATAIVATAPLIKAKEAASASSALPRCLPTRCWRMRCLNRGPRWPDYSLEPRSTKRPRSQAQG